MMLIGFIRKKRIKPLHKDSGLRLYIFKNRLVYYNMESAATMVIDDTNKFMYCKTTWYATNEHINGIDENDLVYCISSSNEYNHNHINEYDIYMCKQLIEKYNIIISRAVDCTLNNNIKMLGA